MIHMCNKRKKRKKKSGLLTSFYNNTLCNVVMLHMMCCGLSYRMLCIYDDIVFIIEYRY